MKLTSIVLAMLLAASANPALAMTYFLSSDLGVSGLQHLCEYSNGKTYSFNATQLCPMSVEEQGVDTGGNAMGFKQGEYQDGMTKVCVYTVLGNQKFLRLDGTELCPLTYNF